MEELEFTPLERKIYDSIYHSAKLNFEQLDAKGLVGKNYTHILAMLMRLVFSHFTAFAHNLKTPVDYGVPCFTQVLYSPRMTSVLYHPKETEMSTSMILFNVLHKANHLPQAAPIPLWMTCSPI